MLNATRRVCKWQSITQFTGDSYLQSMMGHGLNAKSQSELVDKLVSRGFLQLPSPLWVEVIKTVDRADFLPPKSQNMYSNQPIHISPNHSMSTPQFHAQILSLLASRLGPGRVAAEIGCGTGYLPACFSVLGCEQVFAVENNVNLLSDSRKNLGRYSSAVVSESVPTDATLDAVYISPFVSSFSELEPLISSWEFSADALVVAAVRDHIESWDQQLILLERKGRSWDRSDLFRVMCEPLLV